MSARRTLLCVVPLIAAALTLSACGPTGLVASPSPSAAPSSTPGSTPKSSTTPTASASPTPSASPDAQVETGESVALSCNDVVTPQQMYDFNPNFGLINGFVPEAGSLAGQAVAANGIACRWMNQSSGVTIDVSVAHLDAKSTTVRKQFLAANSTSVSSFGPSGYFDQGDVGSAAQAFPGAFWVTAASIAFFGADDAVPIMKAATAAVG